MRKLSIVTLAAALLLALAPMRGMAASVVLNPPTSGPIGAISLSDAAGTSVAPSGGQYSFSVTPNSPIPNSLCTANGAGAYPSGSSVVASCCSAAATGTCVTSGTAEAAQAMVASLLKQGWTNANAAGAHTFNPLGASTAPTSSTGTVTAGSTDQSGEVTGCTSGCTVTFGVAFATKPACTVTDETAATLTKAVPSTTTLVVTTTGTDSFAYHCDGKTGS